MKLQVLDYDKNKALWNFALFKFLEGFGVFLFFFGFKALGDFLWNEGGGHLHPDFLFTPASYIGFWFYGFCCLCLFVIILVIAGLICWGLYALLIAWIKGNWRLAQIYAETKESKKERKKEQEKVDELVRIEEIERQRQEYGYAIGDTAIREKKGGFGKIGSQYKVLAIDGEGDFRCEERGDDFIRHENFKFKHEKYAKPVLSKIREKEFQDRRKKKK